MMVESAGSAGGRSPSSNTLAIVPQESLKKKVSINENQIEKSPQRPQISIPGENQEDDEDDARAGAALAELLSGGNIRQKIDEYDKIDADEWNGEEEIPLEWTWMIMRRIQQERYLIKLCAHVFFGALFVVIFSLMRPIEDTAALHQALVQLTAGAPATGHRASWEKSFKSVSSDREWWHWVETALLPTILTDTFYNGDLRNETWEARFSNTVAMYNTQTARVRFRQARVKRNSCFRPQDNDLERPCWGDFNTGIQEEAPYGEDYGNQFMTGLSSMSSFRDYGPNYGTQGYVVDLPLNKQQALATAHTMKLAGWLNEATSVVAIETSWYNANLDFSTSVRFQLDISPGGRMDPWVTVESCRLFPYAIAGDYIRAGLEVVLAWSLVLLLAEAAYRIRAAPWVFFGDIWNWIEVFTHLLYVMVLLVWFGYWFTDKLPFREVNDGQHEERPDLTALTAHFNFTANMAACAIVLSFVLTFRYLQAFQSFGRLWCTLGKSMGDLAPFLLVFFIFICGFSVAGHWIFGSQLLPFNNYVRAFTTLFLSLVGGFPYDTMRKVAPISALVFSVAWIVVVVFVLTNVFIAIMTEWYRQSTEEERMVDQKVAEKVQKIALAVLQQNAWTIGFKRLMARVRTPKETGFEVLLREAAETLKDAELADLEPLRLALLEGEAVSVAGLTYFFSHLGDEASMKQSYAAYGKITEMKSAAEQAEEAAGEVEDEDEGGTVENEREEQEELQKLQHTVQRLESQLKELRTALRVSEKAPLLKGQAPEGFLLNPAPVEAPPEPPVPPSQYLPAQDQGYAPPMIQPAIRDATKSPTPGGGVGGF